MHILCTKFNSRCYSSISETTSKICSELPGKNHTSSEINGKTLLTQFLKVKLRSRAKPTALSVATEVSFKYASVMICALKAFYVYKDAESNLCKKINLPLYV